MKFFLHILLVIILLGCKQGGSGNNVVTSTENEPPLINKPLADYELLFIGNSHSSKNALPDLVTILIEKGLPNSSANAALAPGGQFLQERLNDGVTMESLTSRSWSHVILQAQKYSSTGLYWYSTESAEEWVRRVKAREATPIMFPEWPRRGNFEEGVRVHELHLEIDAHEPTCVAPIGLAWDEVISIYPQLELHAPDGNHSNLTGALLSAFVFYQVITKQSAADLPYISQIGVSKVNQEKLRDIASYIVADNIQCPQQ